MRSLRGYAMTVSREEMLALLDSALIVALNEDPTPAEKEHLATIARRLKDAALRAQGVSEETPTKKYRVKDGTIDPDGYIQCAPLHSPPENGTAFTVTPEAIEEIQALRASSKDSPSEFLKKAISIARRASLPRESSSPAALCSCKASQRDGQHMAWCPALSSTEREAP
jgi:hypothetical protein